MLAQFIIDVETHDYKKLMLRLKRLKTTKVVQYNGTYNQDQGYAQVLLLTSWNEIQLDEWLYKYSNCDYLGCCIDDMNDKLDI